MTKDTLKIIHTESSCGWGGQEIRILTEAKGMLERGNNVSILCPSHAPIFKEAEERGIPVFHLPIEKKTIKGLLATISYLKKNPVDIINTHSSTDSWMVGLATQFYKNESSTVRTRHVSTPVNNHFPTRWLYTKSAAHIVTTGERLKETLIKDNNYPASMITSVPTGIDMSIFKPADKTEVRAELGLAQDKTIIGILATLRSWKGHKYLIEAISQLKRKDIHLLIVGDGPMKKTLTDQISEAGMEGITTMPGNQKRPAKWLQAMDIFTLPSYANEGVPQGLMQAMLTRLPVISTPVGSITEIIDHEKTGIIIEPEDAALLSKTINDLLDNSEKTQRLAEAGYQVAKQNFTKELMLDRMEKVFRGALKDNTEA